MANTTWNPSDKSANCTLSGSNLIATATNVNAWVRAIDKQITGKFYWEVTATRFTGAGTGTGIASSVSSLAGGFAAGGTGQCALVRNGTVFVDSASQGGIAFGAITSGTVICIAFDAASRLIWFRLGAAGNWNTSAAANPATGVGGVDSKLGAGIPAYPCFFGAVTSEAGTANFGDAAFTGTVPSGFTAGFPVGGGAAAGAQARAMVMA